MKVGRICSHDLELDNSSSWSSGSSRRIQRNGQDICDADREDLVNVDTWGECMDVAG